MKKNSFQEVNVTESVDSLSAETLLDGFARRPSAWRGLTSIPTYLSRFMTTLLFWDQRANVDPVC